MRAPVHVVTPAAFQTWLAVPEAERHLRRSACPAARRAQAGEPGAAPTAPSGGQSEGSGGASTSSGTSTTGGASHDHRRQHRRHLLPPPARRLHRLIRLQRLPHARRGRRHRAPPAPTCGTAARPGRQEGRDGAQAVHLRVDHQAERLHLVRASSRHHAQTFAQTLTPTQIQSLVNFLASVDKVMSGSGHVRDIARRLR